MVETRVIIHGLGRLGKAIWDVCGSGVVAAVDVNATSDVFPVFARLEDCDVAADVIVDCSHAGAVLGLVQNAKLPLVICTTGLSGETLMAVSEAAKRIPILISSNMSLGVNALSKLAAQAASQLNKAGFDIEIIEAHHNQKLDAPSGTALLLANAINDALGGQMKYVYDRSQHLQKRTHDEIGISAIRGGSIVGEHTVILAGQGEVIEITHRALTREIFAIGAAAAASYIKNKPVGLYTMDDLLSK